MRDAQHATRFYYVFAVVDVYSRSRVHCNAFEAETAENAVTFLQAAFDQRHIPPCTALRQRRCHEVRANIETAQRARY